ncbi:MAG: ABC transporter ATP-binding protein, partial [Candidatus Competibacter sp.]|nr:ABC transporter ATP-binding protein [Candidatus Competibacter sp.]
MTPSPTFLAGLKIDRALKLVWRAAPRWTLASVVLLLVQSLVPLATVYIFKLLIDQLTLPDPAQAAGAGFEKLLFLLAVAFGLALVGSLAKAVLGYANDLQTHLVADHMQRLVQAKSIDMDLAYYEHPQFYDQLHRAQREAPSRPLRIVSGLSSVALNGLTVAGALLFLVSFNGYIVLILLAAYLPVLVYRMRYADALYQLHRKKAASERLSGYLNQVLTAAADAKEVRVFGFGPLLARRFSALRATIRDELQRIGRQGYSRQFVTESTAALAGFGALGFIAYSAVHKTITLGELALYFGAFQVALGSLRPALSGLAELYENNLFLSTFYEFLEVPQQVREPAQPRRMPRPWRSGLYVENVSFGYPETEGLILDRVSLTVRPGEIVALVGRNGSGKTTLTKLLCRLYDPDGGSITIDGIDLRQFALRDLRGEISVVYQDFGRYHISARDNILLGQPALRPEDPAIIAAASWAGIHETLTELPQGYDTIMSRTFADGAELSLGQWQKLALARAFVRDSQLILLDEPTSSLDAAAECKFFEKFR